MQETELYGPVKEFLTRLGFDVKGEVSGCDVVATRDGEVVVVELKRTMNLTLLLQGVDRQRMTDSVYLAVAAPKNSRQRRWQECLRLCRMLGLGVITVTRRRQGDWVEVVTDPEPYQPRRSAGRRLRLLQEFNERSGDYNVGGSTRRPLMTAYREEALQIARYLERRGPSRLRDIRTGVGGEKTDSILQNNVYGWFTRLSRGVYALTPMGEKALSTYQSFLQP